MSLDSHTVAFGEGESESDDLSITSSEGQDSYEIERILADDEQQGQKIYLVKWRGYEDFRCTWEPRDSFDSEETLNEWAEQKADGDFLDEDQVNELQARMADYLDEKENRRKQRRSRRRKTSRQQPPRKPRTSTELLNSSHAEQPHSTAKEAPQLVPVPQPYSLPNPTPGPFHGVDASPRARRTTQMQQVRSADNPDPRSGRTFRTLSHANNFNKKARTERAPDPSTLKLKPIDQIMRPEHADTALNLPSADPITPSMRSEPARTKNDLETTVRSEGGGLTAPQSWAIPTPQAETEQRFQSSLYHVPGLAGPQRSLWWNGVDREPKKDDLIVDLTFGGHPVGKVRLIGVPTPLRREMILRKKSKHELPVEFRQENVLKLDEYKQLCRGFSNDILAIVSIDPYDEGAGAALDLAKYLHEHLVTALWNPRLDLASSQTMMLYAPTDPWSFLERGLHVPIRSRIRIAIRNHIPLAGPGFSDTPVHTDDGIQPPPLEADRASTLQQAPQNPPPLPAGKNTEIISSSRTPRHDSEAAYLPTKSPAVMPCTDVEQDPEALGIKYDRLTRLAPNPKVRYDCSKAHFYLGFADPAYEELACLQGYLGKHTLRKLIYSSAEDDGWETFKETLGTSGENVGVILFHKDWTRYETLPGLAQLLRRDNVNVFNVSLREPVLDGLNPHLDRLFPRGMALLITEASMVMDHASTLRILQWFSITPKTKAGGWKLVLRPNIDQFLRESASEAPADLRKSLLSMLVLLNDMHLTRSPTERDSDFESLDFQGEHLNGGVIISPSHLAGYEDHPITAGNTDESGEMRHIQYFAGWTLQNARSYRRFAAVTTLDPEILTNCHHIEVFSPEGFLQATTSRRSTNAK